MFSPDLLLTYLSNISLHYYSSQLTPRTQESSGRACPRCGYHSSSPAIDTTSSPIGELIYTNHSASPLEATHVRSRLEEIQTDCHGLDNDISRLEASLVLLGQKRDNLQQLSALHRGTLSPIRRFPAELLAQIFIHYRPHFQRAYQPTQVCKFWRNVAVSTAGLWTSVDLPLQEGREELEQEMAQQWLERSRGLPITFTLGRIRPKPKLKVASHPCIKLLAAHAHRWRDATINIPTHTIGDLRSVEHNLAWLESLSIGRSSHNRVIETGLLDLFLVAPQLHKLKLGRRYLEEILNMPWRQLTRCTLVGDYNAVECYDIIKDCPNLSYCELAVTGISDSVEDDIDLQPSIAHPNIDVLKIRNEETLLRLLERLELPVLTEFAHTSPSPVLSLYTHTASLFLRSAPPLRRLELDNMAHARDSDLIDCLEQCPSLQELSLTSNSASGVSEWFLHRLTHFPELEQCCLVPKLQSFTVSVSWDFGFEAFTKMIKSRRSRHGLECRAVDHKAVEQIRKATLHRMSNSQAVDAVDRRDKNLAGFTTCVPFRLKVSA